METNLFNYVLVNNNFHRQTVIFQNFLIECFILFTEHRFSKMDYVSPAKYGFDSQR